MGNLQKLFVKKLIQIKLLVQAGSILSPLIIIAQWRMQLTDWICGQWTHDWRKTGCICVTLHYRCNWLCRRFAHLNGTSHPERAN